MMRSGWPWALAVLALSNGLLLARTAFNRAGDPDASVRLTQRELSSRLLGEEGSTAALRLEWEQRRDWLGDGPGWFDRAKLQALGFDCGVPPGDAAAASHYAKALPRNAYVVLEQEGEAWQEWLAQNSMGLAVDEARVENGEMTPDEYRSAQDAFLRARQTRSRLFAVDAGRQPEELRRRYPDRRQFLIADGIVGLALKSGRSGPYLAGEVSRILPDTLQIPRGKRAVLESLGRRSGSPASDPGRYWAEPRETLYRLTLCYGRLYEPWVDEIETPR